MNNRTLLFAAALLAGAAEAQAPSNNGCSTPLVVFDGVNPQPPNGTSGQYFTNVGATNSSTSSFPIECGAAFNKDVWFEYTASRTGTYSIRTCTPSGFTAGSLTETVIAVYDSAACPSGATPIACNDDSFTCGLLSNRSSVSVDLFDNVVYLIRVGTEHATQSGTFYLTVEAPAASSYDSCLFAQSLAMGDNALTFDGSNVLTSTYGCSNFGSTVSDVWFTWTTGLLQAINPCEMTLTTTGASDYIAVYTGTCSLLGSSFTLVACGGQQATFSPSGVGTEYFIRCGMAQVANPSGLAFNLNLTCSPHPPNDACANGLTILGGTIPYLPAQDEYTTTVGAVTTPGLTPCATFNSDVWFDYIATTSGKVLVSTVPPNGYAAGSMTDTVLAVYASCGGALIACNDDVGSGLYPLRSELEFDATQGVHYRIMVADFGTHEDEGTFTFSIYPRFALTMSSPLGAGSFQLNLQKGGPFHFFYTCLTLNAGAYPYGPFYGIEPTFTEIIVQLTSNAQPFLGALDGAGAYQFGPLTGGPAGLTLYGVTLEFDAVGSIAGVTNFTNHTIP
jgi:hypothetical protein